MFICYKEKKDMWYRESYNNKVLINVSCWNMKWGDKKMVINWYVKKVGMFVGMLGIIVSCF